jgi:hypothetical protein
LNEKSLLIAGYVFAVKPDVADSKLKAVFAVIVEG